jgi:amino acid permease
MSMVVWVIMNTLGEMTTYLPVQGVSIPYFVNRFAEPSLAFAVGMILLCSGLPHHFNARYLTVISRL